MPSVQDDSRENELIKLFNLSQDEDRNRSDIDAFVILNNKRINFELKSTTDRNRSITTARDFSFNHIQKMRNEHWIFGFYNQSNPPILEYCLYASPNEMKQWLDEKEEYLKPDVMISSLFINNTSLIQFDSILNPLFGIKNYYTIEDAKKIQKKQYNNNQYNNLCDIEINNQKYISKNNMINVINDRAKYLLSRGTTLNNPHIPNTYFENWKWPAITNDHSKTLLSYLYSYFYNNA